MADSEIVRARMEGLSDEELIHILALHDEEQWRPEVFQIVEEVLRRRGLAVEDMLAAARADADEETPHGAPVASEPFSPSRVLGGQDSGDTPIEEATEAELRTVIGPRSDYYVTQWCAKRKFNWAAFFLAGLWLPFRRMYAVAAIFYGIIIVATILTQVSLWRLGYPWVPPVVDRLLQLAAAVVIGASSNGWYLGRLRNIIAATRTLALPEDEHLRTLSVQGGTRAWHAAGFFALAMIAMYAVDAALQLPMLRWLLEGTAQYAVIVAISLVGSKPMATVLRLIAAAWILVALGYLPFAYGAIGQARANGAWARLSWPAASPWVILLLVPAAALLIWKGRDELGSLLLVLVAANWVFLEIFGLHLATLRWPPWTWGVPLLSLLTMGVLGSYALWKSIHTLERSL